MAPSLRWRSRHPSVDVVTDPEDQSLVAGLEYPVCQAKGTLVLPFGPDLSPEEGEIVAALRVSPEPDQHPRA